MTDINEASGTVATTSPANPGGAVASGGGGASLGGTDSIAEALPAAAVPEPSTLVRWVSPPSDCLAACGGGRRWRFFDGSMTCIPPRGAILRRIGYRQFLEQDSDSHRQSRQRGGSDAAQRGKHLVDRFVGRRRLVRWPLPNAEVGEFHDPR